MRKYNNKEKGASLVELIVVMAIILILTSIAVVSYTMFIRNAKKLKAEQELTQVYNLIYMDADQYGIEIDYGYRQGAALYVTTSGNKIVLIFNDVPSNNLEEDWEYNNLNNWQEEDNWNDLIRSLIDYVTDDIGIFSGVFELDPEEDIAKIANPNTGEIEIIRSRNLTYILENDERLRARKELIVTTLNDTETIIRFLNDLEARENGRLVPVGMARENSDDIEELTLELWFVWTASATHVLADSFEGTLNITVNYDLLDNEGNILPEQDEANLLLHNLLLIDYEGFNGQTITSDMPFYILATLTLKEPANKEQYELIAGKNFKITFTINIDDVRLPPKDNQG